MTEQKSAKVLEQLSSAMLPAIEEELRRAMKAVEGPGLDELRRMLAYHLGWEGQGAGPAAAGKRIRPLLVLLTTAAAGGDWRCALPGGAAIELVHNFSLIHDDIEDNSPLRRGRLTVWNQWGIPQAINAGDAMFTLAHLALLRLEETTSGAITLRAARVLQETCLHLTQGQYLDISFENKNTLSVKDYWQMVGGKTAALLGACTEIGALAAGAPEKTIAAYQRLGVSLGLAFQAQDDLLGIWGDSRETGKSVESDLLAGKKTLPVLFGLEQNGPFAQRWLEGPVQASEVPALAAQLEKEGALAYTQENAARLTRQALDALDEASPGGEAALALRALAVKLMQRKA